MTEQPLPVVTHGGAGAPAGWKDGTDQALDRALEALAGDKGTLAACVEAVASMEDDPRFNAGTGSNLRRGGQRIQMDASVATSQARFGAVACIEQVRHPVRVAQLVLGTPHRLLAGADATAFARENGHEAHDPSTEQAREDHRRAQAREGGSDTVGCVAFDGELFAAALSSGGTQLALPGRVGDVPLPGCGLHVGAAGAVACTGHGEAIARELAAYRIYRLMEAGQAPQQACEAALPWFSQEEEFGVIAVDEARTAAASNTRMPWSSNVSTAP